MTSTWKHSFRLDIRMKSYTVRVIKHKNRLLKEAVDIPPLEGFEPRMDGILSNWLSKKSPCPWQEVGARWSLRSLLTRIILGFCEESLHCQIIIYLLLHPSDTLHQLACLPCTGTCVILHSAVSWRTVPNPDLTIIITPALCLQDKNFSRLNPKVDKDSSPLLNYISILYYILLY